MLQKNTTFQYEGVKAHIRQLLEGQVIRESCNLFALSIVLVQYKDGTLMLCVQSFQLYLSLLLYLDDEIVFSSSFKQHVQLLELVLCRLND